MIKTWLSARFFCFFFVFIILATHTTMEGWPTLDCTPELNEKLDSFLKTTDSFAISMGTGIKNFNEHIDTFNQKFTSFKTSIDELVKKIDPETTKKFLAEIGTFNNNVTHLTDKVETLNSNVKSGIKAWNNTVDTWKHTNQIVQESMNTITKEPKFQTIIELAADIKNGGLEKRVINTWDRALNVISLKLIGSLGIAAGLAVIYHVITTHNDEDEETNAEKDTKKTPTRQRLEKFARTILPPTIGTILVVAGLSVILKARNISAAIT